MWLIVRSGSRHTLPEIVGLALGTQQLVTVISNNSS